MASGDSVGSRKTSDFLLSSIVGGSEETYTYECDACKLDGAIREGKFYCCSCEDFLCSECESFHKKVKVTRSHEIVAADDAKIKKYPNKTALGQAAEPNTDELCTCSQQKHVEFYCKEHADMFCSLCKKVLHSRCNTATIDEASSAKDFPDTFKTTINKLELLLKKTQELEKKSDNAMVDLEKMEISCSKDIREIRSEVNLLFDKLEQAALEDLKLKATEQLDMLKDANAMIKSTVHLLNTDKSKAEEVKNNSEKQHMFVNCTKLNKTLPSYDAAVDVCKDKLVIPSLTFVKHPVLAYLHVNLDSLGNVNSPLRSAKVENVTFVDAEIITHRIVNVKDIADSDNPWITGIAFLSNGNLLVADQKNARITLFDKELNKRTSMKCDDKPWGIAVLDEEQVLVTCVSGHLRYLQVGMNDNLTFIKKKELRGVRGISFKDGLIYTVSSGKTSVLILDRCGSLKRTIKKEQIQEKYTGSNKYYIEVSREKDHLYLQDDTRVLSITTNGDIIRTYTHPAMKNARDLVIDDEDNILIGCHESHNLHIFSCDGSKHKMLLSQENQIAKPYGIAFRASDGTLAVGDWETGKLHVLTLASK